MAYTLITGASAGIGAEFARQYAAKGNNLILVARNQERLNTLAKELSDRHSIKVQVIAQDLSILSSAERVRAACENEGWAVDLLINNAGFGLYGPFASHEPHKIEEMLMLNMVSLSMLTRLFITDMLTKKSGGIINVASTAAFQPIPNMAEYAATKAYVLSLSEALHAEVGSRGVRVMALCPGPTATEFFDRAEAASGSPGRKRFKSQTVEEVVSLAISRFEQGDRTVVPGLRNKVSSVAAQIVPRSMVLKITQRMMKTNTRV